MTTEVTFDSDYEDVWEFANTLSHQYAALWQGRQITLEDAIACRQGTAQTVLDLFDSWDEDDPAFDRMAAQMIWAGTPPEERSLLDREIQYLVTGKDEVFIMEAGVRKSARKFWHKHKKAIIITVVVVAVIVTVGAVIVYANGAGAREVAVCGAALLKSLAESEDKAIKPASQFGPDPISADPPQIQSPSIVYTELSPTSEFDNSFVNCFPEGALASGEPPTGSFSSMEYPLPTHYGLPWVEMEEEIQPPRSISSLPLNLANMPREIRDRMEEFLQSLPPETPKQWPFFKELWGDPHNARWEPLSPAEILACAEAQKIRRLEEQAHEDVQRVIDGFCCPSKTPGKGILKKISPEEMFCPFSPQQMELIGNPNQGTLHYHCGIHNTADEVDAAGQCLYGTLNQQYAVQPNWIHKQGMVTGLASVVLEKTFPELPEIPSNPIARALFGFDLEGISLKEYALKAIGHEILQRSDIEKSIAYEVEYLSSMAQYVLEQNNPKLKQVHVTFSNGGHVMNEALKRLPDDYKDTIIVITTGTTKIIDKDAAHAVYNIIGEKDWASQICNGGMEEILAAKKRANITIIPQTETQSLAGGHFFLQPDYQDEAKDTFDKKIKVKYEVL